MVSTPLTTTLFNYLLYFASKEASLCSKDSVSCLYCMYSDHFVLMVWYCSCLLHQSVLVRKTDTITNILSRRFNIRNELLTNPLEEMKERISRRSLLDFRFNFRFQESGSYCLLPLTSCMPSPRTGNRK